MSSTKLINIIEEVDDDLLGEDVETFLNNLRGPTWLCLEGKDTTRTRVFSTLLHGNEPSGVRALHKWLKLHEKPQTNVCCFICSVHTALTPPLFSYRMLPKHRDMNRTFNPPYKDHEGKTAEYLLTLLNDVNPECMVDMHNTTGSSKGFGIATIETEKNKALASLFTDKLIITDLKLGSLMEATENLCPSVSIEAGGANDPLSDEVAYAGISRFFAADDWYDYDQHKLSVIHHPLRLELEKGAQIGYASSQVPEWDITIPLDVEKYNYQMLAKDTAFAWVGPKGLDILTIENVEGENIVEEYFEVKANKLYSKQTLKLFMVTTNPVIAQADCLFYIVQGKEYTHAIQED